MSDTRKPPGKYPLATELMGHLDWLKHLCAYGEDKELVDRQLQRIALMLALAERIGSFEHELAQAREENAALRGKERGTFGMAVVDIAIERARQDQKWGIQNHGDQFWLAILVEEIGEVAQAICQSTDEGGDPSRIRKEIIESAAVAIAWLECIARWTRKPPAPEEN